MVIPVKFAGRVWLNGEFGVSRQREALFSGKIENDYHCPIHREVMRSLVDSWGVSAVLDWVLSGKGSEGANALGLSNVPKPHGSKKPRGSGGITPYGRKMLRNAATLLQQENQHWRLSFLTLTIPRCTLEQYEAVVKDWAEIQRQFQQGLRRRLISRGLPGELLSCTEIQEERFAGSGVPALHLHIVFQGKDRKRASWAVTPKMVRKMWVQILKPRMPSVTDWRAVENLKQVRKDAAAYIGKYMSKGVLAVAAMTDAGLGHLLPSAWWNASFSLRRRVIAHSMVGYSIGEKLINLIDRGKANWFKWLQPIKLPLSTGGEYIVGWSGRLHDWAYRILKSEDDERLDKRGKISLSIA